MSAAVRFRWSWGLNPRAAALASFPPLARVIGWPAPHPSCAYSGVGEPAGGLSSDPFRPGHGQRARWAASSRGAGVCVLAGGDVRAAHAFSFAPRRLVIRLVRPLHLFMEAAMQRQLPLLCRIEGPAVVPASALRAAKTYRQAVRLCRQVSPRRHLALRQLAEEAGLTYQHVSDYFNADDKPTRRDLPGSAVARVEAVLGNAAITQWHAMQARLTVLEEMQAERAA